MYEEVVFREMIKKKEIMIDTKRLSSELNFGTRNKKLLQEAKKLGWIKSVIDYKRKRLERDWKYYIKSSAGRISIKKAVLSRGYRDETVASVDRFLKKGSRCRTWHGENQCGEKSGVFTDYRQCGEWNHADNYVQIRGFANYTARLALVRYDVLVEGNLVKRHKILDAGEGYRWGDNDGKLVLLQGKYEYHVSYSDVVNRTMREIRATLRENIPSHRTEVD